MKSLESPFITKGVTTQVVHYYCQLANSFVCTHHLSWISHAVNLNQEI